MPETIGTVERDFDIVVIGGGIVGSCLTWFLADDGAAVVCLDDGRDKGSIANAGSLHVQMQSRVGRQFPERAADFEATLSIYPRAADFWAEIARGFDEDIEISIGGGLMIADSSEQMKRLADKSAREGRQGVETELLGRQELLRLAPYLTDDAAGALFCAREGKVNPLLANEAIRRRVVSKGGSIRHRCTAERIERDGTGYAVVCDGVTYRCGTLVIAAGSGSGRLASSLGLSIPTLPEPLQMNITDSAEPFMQHLLQHAERPLTLKQTCTGQVIIGGGWPAQHDPQSGRSTVLLDSLLGNLAVARRIVPGIRDLPVIRSWAGINTIVDLLSVLGEVPGLPRLFVAVPGDAGYTLGPYCARLVADVVAGREPDYPLARFSPARFDVALSA